MIRHKSQTACFTGHRRLPAEKIDAILSGLNETVESLIAAGVTDFISGGALGFDQIAAALIISKRQMGHNIRLTFALPCADQDKYWSEKARTLYRDLLNEADEVVCLSPAYHASCMKERNRYMIDHCAYCVCALLESSGGTYQTIRYARRNGVTVVNVV